jgi:hypothetical protein
MTIMPARPTRKVTPKGDAPRTPSWCPSWCVEHWCSPGYGVTHLGVETLVDVDEEYLSGPAGRTISARPVLTDEGKLTMWLRLPPTDLVSISPADWTALRNIAL